MKTLGVLCNLATTERPKQSIYNHVIPQKQLRRSVKVYLRGKKLRLPSTNWVFILGLELKKLSLYSSSNFTSLFPFHENPLVKT